MVTLLKKRKILIVFASAFMLIILPKLLHLQGSEVKQIAQHKSPGSFGELRRREIDLNVTPTASSEQSSPHRPESPNGRSQGGQYEDVQSNGRQCHRKDTESYSSPTKKPVKKQYESRKLSLKRFQFKFSLKGQELAKDLPPEEKVKYDEHLERIRQKRRFYKSRNLKKMKTLVEQNDPIGLRRNQLYRESARRAYRKYSQKKRAKKCKQGNASSDNLPQPGTFMKRGEIQGNGNDQQMNTQAPAQQPFTRDEQAVSHCGGEKKKYRDKFSLVGQEQAKGLNEEARKVYNEQLIKHHARERKGRKLYRKKIKFLVSQNDPKAIESYRKSLQTNYASVVRHRERKKIEKASMIATKPGKPSMKRRKKTIVPDLNKSPPPDLDAN
ncbi:uncharacterized protein FA14DRAFT_177077 [Meira miltonrushii]|uniref:Uncharacterized protein n=1 Tax=Meira miltonrushii TaxID=1280837 RepID=A0A316VQM2_9BASI|nr:uncharacterized protein FA14DRAFT_177077 [Meira miltonrushii]PWN37795.1 hypothetical protein FA14DRAFT_177077 [Meira miltonrushii]